jgi:hypothetical protein
MSNSMQFVPGYVPKFELFTASGTWTLPTNIVADSSGNSVIRLTAIAGGGSGARRSSGDAAAGGNSGEFVQHLLVEVSANQTVTIGAGGAAKTTTGAGNAGGNTVFGSITLTGGGGGVRASSGGPSAQGGNIGGWHQSIAGNMLIGSGPFAARATINDGTSEGAGAPGLVLDATDTNAGGTTDAMGGRGYGSGGAAENSGDSGAGAAGVVLVEWWEYA